MESLTMKRLRMQDFPNRSFYCIQQKMLEEGYPLHRHDFFEIEFVLSGEGEHYLNGQRYPLKRGSVYFLNLNDFHEITTSKPVEVLTFMFSDHWISTTLLYQFLSADNDKQCELSEEDFVSALRIAERIKQEYDADHPLRDAALRNITEYLLILLIRFMGVSYTDLIEDADHPVSQVLMYLTAHFRDNPSLSTVAAMVNHNSNYFSELFHNTTGRSYVQYLNSLKLNYARKLLSTTDSPITEICSASGFNSYSGFSHAFRKEYGCSAIEFRKEQKKSKRSPK